MLGSVHCAEDAIQDALLRAWRGLPRFDGSSRALQTRRSTRRPTEYEELLARQADTIDLVEQAQLRAARERAVLAKDAALDPDGADTRVRRNARAFLDHAAGHYWPGAATDDGRFRWELLTGGDLDAQYWRANVDPSDQYVQSLPGTGRARLRADGSGYENLVLAGDWIDCGLNAGCIEAAAIAGVQAANAVRRRPLMDDVLGLWCYFESTGAR